jgi:uncharacterized membrane protein
MSAGEHTTSRIQDTQVEIAIGVLLRVGVMLAAAVVLLGAALYLAQHGGAPVPDYKSFHGVSAELHGLRAIVSGALALHADAIMQLGLVLLIATPVARVMFAAVAFALERDMLYVGFTLLVLAVLLFGLFDPALR